jgi:hypothetical protein
MIEHHPGISMSDAAKDLARAINELDKLLVGVKSGDLELGDVWLMLREIHERAAAAFQGVTGRTVKQTVGRRS